jgi:serine/threonine protein kinase
MISKAALGYEVDVWTTGVLVYKMLYGKVPFEGDDIESVSKNIMSRYPLFKGKDKGCLVSFAAQDLLRKMLDKSPEKRIKL